MENCNCKQCKDLGYVNAIIQAIENNRPVNLAKILKHYDTLRPVAQYLFKKAMQWTFTGDE